MFIKWNRLAPDRARRKFQISTFSYHFSSFFELAGNCNFTHNKNYCACIQHKHMNNNCFLCKFDKCAEPMLNPQEENIKHVQKCATPSWHRIGPKRNFRFTHFLYFFHHCLHCPATATSPTINTFAHPSGKNILNTRRFYVNPAKRVKKTLVFI